MKFAIELHQFITVSRLFRAVSLAKSQAAFQLLVYHLTSLLFKTATTQLPISDIISTHWFLLGRRLSEVLKKP